MRGLFTTVRVALRADQSCRSPRARRLEIHTATPELATNKRTRRRWFSCPYWRGGVLSTNEKTVAYRPTSAVRLGVAKEAAMNGPIARNPISPNAPPYTSSTMATPDTHTRATQVTTDSMRSCAGWGSSPGAASLSGSATWFSP